MTVPSEKEMVMVPRGPDSFQSHFPRKAGNPQLPPLIQGIFRAFVTRGEPDGLLGQGTAVLPLKAGEDGKASFPGVAGGSEGRRGG